MTRPGFVPLLLLSQFLLWQAALAQKIKYNGQPFRMRGSFSQKQMPPDALDLVPIAGAQKGKVWVEHGPDGIFVITRFENTDQPHPNWARFPAEMNRRAHVNLWLAFATDVPMPPIGWGSQFGPVDCKTYDPQSARLGGEDCAAWSARQAAYRDELKKLFVRQWRLSAHAAEEVFASEAYRKALSYARDHERARFQRLEPDSLPYLQDAHSFEINVRWSDFPPASSLTLSRIYLALEFFDGAVGHSTTARTLRPGNPATFNRLDFERPQIFRVDACGSALQGANAYQELQPAWFLPSERAEALDVFTLANDASGYRYDPEGLSPIPRWTHHFSKHLGGGNLVCGPPLAYVPSGGTVDQAYKSDYWIEESPLSFLKQADGSYLLKWGPRLGTRSFFGTGQGGSNAAVRVDIFHLNPGAGATRALAAVLELEDPEADGDIQFSADWKTVTIYTGKFDYANNKLAWSSERYCLGNGKYEACNEEAPAGPPPEPRQVSLPKY